MKRILVVGIGLCVLGWTTMSAAYEPGTHERLTDDAILQSVLNPSSGDVGLFDDWGLDVNKVFGDDHFGLHIELGLHEDDRPMPAQGTFEILMDTGAEFEDYATRGLCHFYDPVNKTPLHLGLETATYSAPEWATGVLDSGGDLPDYNVCHMYVGSENQQYALKKAQQRFYNAFTAQNESDTDRANDFGHLFLSLGHVLHVLEDMGQPQHVRNDMHCDNYLCLFGGYLYNPSKYENHVYDMYNSHEGSAPGTPYAPVSLVSARSYWSDDAGEGLADYTNRNFFSAGTLDLVTGAGDGYASPQVDNQLPPITENASALFPGGMPFAIYDFCRHRPTQACVVTFLPTYLEDRVNGASPIINNVAVSRSFFNKELSDAGAHEIYTLNRVTEASAWGILYPQIVSYGSGLINHIFRGRLNVQWNQSNPGGPNTSNLQVMNLSDGDLSSNGSLGSDLGIYYDGSDGKRYRANQNPNTVSIGAYCNPVFNGQPNPNCSFLPSDKTLVSVSRPLSPPAAYPNEYIFVYKGAIGSDTDEHIAAFNYKPSDYFGYLMDDRVDGQIIHKDGFTSYASDLGWGGSGVGTVPVAQCGTPVEYCYQQVAMAEYNFKDDGKDRTYVLRDGWGVDLFEGDETFLAGTKPLTQIVNWTSISNNTIIKFPRAQNTAFQFPQFQDCFASNSPTGAAGSIRGMAINDASLYLVAAYGEYSTDLNAPSKTECQYGSPGPGGSSQAGYYLDIFNHNGTFQGASGGHRIRLLDFYEDPVQKVNSELMTFSVNDQALCMVGLKTFTDTGQQTRFIVLKKASDGSDAGVTINDANPISCATTSDRYYVLDSDGTLSAYDYAGNRVGSRVLSEMINAGYSPGQVAAVSNTIYVSTVGSPAFVYRFQRKIVSGADTFILAETPATHPQPFRMGNSGSIVGLSVDAYEALNLLGPQ